MTDKQNLAFLFPGQGSQQVGMCDDLAQAFPEVKTTFAEASQALGYDLWQVVSQGPEASLNQTACTQPALLAASVATWRLLNSELAIHPAAFAGHSLGEYSALVCAGALTFSDAIQLVAARGHYMQEAVPDGKGAMAAIIGLADTEVAQISATCANETNLIVTPANYNSVGQVVVAGDKEAVDLVIVRAKAAGAKMAVLLPVSVPSHCALMQGAAKRLAELLTTITLQIPKIPVINNVDVMPYTSVDSMRDGLIRQLYLPVRWVETINYLKQMGITTMVECGPGKVLAGLTKRIDKTITIVNLNTAEQITTFIKETVRSE